MVTGQVQALRNFADLLIEEDKRMKKNSKESKEGKEAPDIQAEHTEYLFLYYSPLINLNRLGGGLLQLFIQGMLDLTSDKDQTVRLNALSAISLIIRHGLVNPYDV